MSNGIWRPTVWDDQGDVPASVFVIAVGYDSSAVSAVGTVLHRLAVWKIEPRGTHDPA